MKVLGGLALVCFVLLDLGGIAGNETNCAKIIFKHPQGNYMEVEEHSSASIVFQVRNVSCSHLQDEEIHVKWKKEKFDYCRIIDLTDWMDALCQCKDYWCSVNNNFSRGESPWTFSSPGDRIKDETFNVNVTYPQNVTYFTLSGNGKINITENTTIQAVCQWQNGNPRKRILLRHPRNQIISEKWPTHVNDVNLSKYIFVSNTSCRDSGLYRCEVEGSGEYKSASLQIECPPQFLESAITADTVMSGQNVTRHYNLFSFINITNCTLKGPGNAQPQDCVSNKSQVSVTGTHPQLKLTLLIRNVREEDNGTWQLSVENGFKGRASIPNVASVNFTLGVIPETSSNTPTVTTAPPTISPGMYTLFGVVGFLVLVIISLLVFIAVYTKKKRQDRGVIIRTGDADTQGGGPQDRGRGSHFYEEIPEIPRTQRFHHHGQRQIPQPRGSPALSPTPAVDTLPDDYLHPVDNTPSTSGTNQSAGTSAAPAGPYDSLEMSDVGLRSAYSQLGM